jgi:hypothetical protein
MLPLDGIGDLGEEFGVVLADGFAEGRVGGHECLDFVAAGTVDGERIGGRGSQSRRRL